jgi:hypothetical protein
MTNNTESPQTFKTFRILYPDPQASNLEVMAWVEDLDLHFTTKCILFWMAARHGMGSPIRVDWNRGTDLPLIHLQSFGLIEEVGQ